MDFEDLVAHNDDNELVLFAELAWHFQWIREIVEIRVGIWLDSTVTHH